jgi:hypothetical protein
LTKINRKNLKIFKGLRTKNNGNERKMTLEYQKMPKNKKKIQICAMPTKLVNKRIWQLF